MSNRLYLASPLEIEEWEVVEQLDQYALYDDFHHRIEQAVMVLEEGQSFWREHCSDEGVWSQHAIDTVGDVRRRSYNIRNSREFYYLDLPACIRAHLREVSGEGISDCQLVAALAMDRACWVIEMMARWFADFEEDLQDTQKGLIEQAEEYPFEEQQDAMTLCREDWLRKEMEVREDAADYLGHAAEFMMYASLYAKNPKSQTQILMARMAARKAGQLSGAVRKEAREERNQRICAAAQRMLASGITDGLAARIARTAAAEKEPGGEKLSRRQIENILRSCGVIE